jgi:Zn-dependent peptidase ImmA (M78 family)/transcriptional regulator with XRE-family HTH domain
MAEVSVAPPVFNWARTSAGLSADELAIRLSVDTTRVSAWEQGKERIPISKLRQFAQIVHRPLAAFLLSTPPVESGLPKDFRSIPGSGGPRLFTPETLLAVRKARRVQAAFAALNPEAASRTRRRLPSIRTDENPETAAAKVVGPLGFYEWPAVPRFKTDRVALHTWRESVEKNGVLALQLPFPVDDARGFSLVDEGVPTLVLSENDSPKARVFTLFHELCHVLLRTEGICDPFSVGYGAGRSVEAFCNHFAGAALVPSEALLPELPNWQLELDDVRDLSNRFQVSSEVILRRLLILGRLKQAEHSRLVGEYRALFASKKRQRRSAMGGRDIALARVNEYGGAYVSAILDSAKRGEISASEVADLLDIRLKHLENIESLAVRS